MRAVLTFSFVGSAGSVGQAILLRIIRFFAYTQACSNGLPYPFAKFVTTICSKQAFESEHKQVQRDAPSFRTLRVCPSPKQEDVVAIRCLYHSILYVSSY